MAESRTTRFLGFLSRIRSSRRLKEEDVESISHFAINNNDERVPEVIHYENQGEEMEQFLRQGFRTYRSAELGLAALGWKELPSESRPTIDEGAFASISLAYKLSDRRLPLESRHLTVAKIQRLEVLYRVWTEVEILRGIVHENIVGFYGMFAVDPEMETDHTDHYKISIPDQRPFWILLEYANAHNMAKELRRYENNSIEETGARYYLLQICAGVGHLHSKRIVHKDLHPGNVLLKYNPDGTKMCMICDFGKSVILHPNEPIVPFTFQIDVLSICRIAGTMMRRTSKSKEAFDMISGHCGRHDTQTTIPELLAFPWFAGPVCAPIPKEPTPILQPDVVERIGYLPPLHPSGTTSQPRIAHGLHRPSGAEAVTPSDSRGGSFAQRMRDRLRSIPDRVRTRISSMPCVGGRARRLSEPELEEQPSRRRHEH